MSDDGHGGSHGRFTVPTRYGAATAQMRAFLDHTGGLWASGALVGKVAHVIGKPFQEVWDRTRLCGSAGAPPSPQCFNGSPYQPIPVTDEASTAMALQIMERREDFPGVTAELTSVREYPGPMGANAAHELGYLGPVSDTELTTRQKEIKAGKDLYGSGWSTFWHVTWPTTFQGVLAGTVLVFLPAVGDFVSAQLLGGPNTYMIGNLIQQQFFGAENWPFGAALTTLLMLFLMVWMVFYLRSAARAAREATIA